MLTKDMVVDIVPSYQFLKKLSTDQIPIYIIGYGCGRHRHDLQHGGVCDGRDDEEA